jgi:hypothetical protein
MPTFAYNPPVGALLSGRVDYAIIEKEGKFLPWSRTREHPWCADRVGAYASIQDMVHADGYSRLNRLNPVQVAALF